MFKVNTNNVWSCHKSNNEKYFLTLNGNCDEFNNFIEQNKINNLVKINIDNLNHINYVHTNIDRHNNIIYNLKDLDVTKI